jgi:TP901 family phage tail tape measure protein
MSEKAAVALQSALTNVGNTANLTSAQTDALGKTLVRLAIGTTSTATNMANALSPIVGELQLLTGHAVDAADATSLLTAAQNLYVVKSIPLTTATKEIVDLLRTYKLGVSDAATVSDALIQGSDLLGIGVDQVASSFTRLQPKIAGSGLDMQQFLGIVVEMGPAVGTGSRALMQVGTLIHALIVPSKAAAAALKDIGVSLYDAKGNYIGAEAAIQKISVAYNKLGTQAQKTALLQSLFGAQAGIAATLIAGGAAGINKATAEMEANGTAAEKAALKMQDAQEQMALLPKTLSDISTAIGMVLLPGLNRLLSAILPVILGIGDWVTANPELATTILAVVAAGGLLVGTLAFVGPAVAALGTAVAIILSPVVLIGAAVGVLIRYLMQIPTVAAPVKAIFQDLYSTVFNTVSLVKGALSELFQGPSDTEDAGSYSWFFTSLRNQATMTMASLSKSFALLGAALMNLLPPRVQDALIRVQYWLMQWDLSLRRLYTSIMPLVTIMTVGLKGALDSVSSSFGNTGNANSFITVINWVGDSVNHLIDWLAELLTFLGGTSERSENARRALLAVAGVLSALWVANKGIQFFQLLSTAVKGVITTAQDFMTPIAKLADALRAIPGIPGAISDGFDTLRLKAMYAQDAIGNFISKLTSIPSNVFNDLKQAIQDVGDKLKSIPSGMLDTLKDKLDTLKIKAWDARDAIGTIGDKIKAIVSTNLDTIKGKLADIKQGLKDISAKVQVAISTSMPSINVTQIGSTIASAIAGAIAGALSAALMASGLGATIAEALGSALAGVGALLASPIVLLVAAIIAYLTAAFLDPKDFGKLVGGLVGLLLNAFVIVPLFLVSGLVELGYQIATNLFQSIQDAIGKIPTTASAIGAAIGNLLNDAAGQIGDDASALLGGIGNWIGSVVGGLSTAFAPLWTGFKTQFSKGISQLANTIQSLLKGDWGGAIKSAIGALGTFFGSLPLSIGANLISGLLMVRQQFVGWVMSLPGAIGTAIGSLIADMQSIGRQLVGAIGTGLSGLGGVVQSAFGGLLTWLRGWSSQLFDGFQSGFSSTAGLLTDSLRGFVGQIMNIVTPIPGNILKALKGIWDGLWNTIGTVTTTITNGIGTIVADAGKLPGKIATAVKGMWDSLVTEAEKLPGQLLDFFTKTLIPMLGKSGQIGLQLIGAMLQLGKNIVEAIINGIIGLPGAIAKAIGDAFRSINITVGPFHITGSGISVSLPSISIPSVSLPKLFAEGAWNIPNTMPGVVHAGEMIVPAKMAENLRAVLSSIGTMSGSLPVSTPSGMAWSPPSYGGASSDSTQTHHIHVMLDGRQIAEVVDRHQGVRYLLHGSSRYRATGN